MLLLYITAFFAEHSIHGPVIRLWVEICKFNIFKVNIEFTTGQKQPRKNLILSK